MRILAIETSCDDTAIAIVEATPIRGRKIPYFRVLSNIVSSQTKIHKKYGGVVPSLAKRAHQENLVPVLERALGEAEMLLNPKSSRFVRSGEAREIRNPKQYLNSKLKILNSILAREQELLKQFLKVIPKIKKPSASRRIDLIAVTHGPGLEPALWAGVNFARALSCLWNIPLVGVNHMEGHMAANFLREIGGITNYPRFARSGHGFARSLAKRDKARQLAIIKFPAVALAVSGGHTQLILIKDIGKYKLLGETVDDAAGEGFDKVARMLGLGFPGGPEIAKAARGGNPKAFDFPRPMAHSKDYNFSFSGLKTAVLYTLKKLTEPALVSPRETSTSKPDSAQSIGVRPRWIDSQTKKDIAASFQQAAVDVLIAKTIRAAKEYKAKTIMLGGGVAANTELRKQLGEKIQEELPRLRHSFARGYGSTKQGFGGQAITNYQLPSVALSTDNAAMIAAAAYFHKDKATLTRWKTLKADGNLKIR